MDIEIFLQHLAPRLGITRRYVGSEPLSALTAAYNKALKEKLPPAGIAVREIARIEASGTPISASTVRELIAKRDEAALARFLPPTTLEYLRSKNYI